MTETPYQISRRRLLASAGAFVAVAAIGNLYPVEAMAQANNVAASLATDGPFTRSTVAEIARRLSRVPFAAPSSRLPEVLQNLTYDQYRDIRFKAGASVWADDGLPFKLQLFHPGFYFKEPIEVAIVKEGQAKHLPYSTNMFDFGPLVPKGIPDTDMGFAGIRVHGGAHQLTEAGPLRAGRSAPPPEARDAGDTAHPAAQVGTCPAGIRWP